MIQLPVEVLEILEKVAKAEDEFVTLFKGLSVGGSDKFIVPPDALPTRMIQIHTPLLLHIIANLVEAQTKIEQLERQVTVLEEDRLLQGKILIDRIKEET